jgi:hypothetical protein
LLTSAVANANTIQLPTLQVGVWSEHTGVGVRRWAAEIIGIWQDKGSLTIQQKNNKVGDNGWESVQSMSSTKKQGAGPEQWNLLTDHCIT